MRSFHEPGTVRPDRFVSDLSCLCQRVLPVWLCRPYSSEAWIHEHSFDFTDIRADALQASKSTNPAFMPAAADRAVAGTYWSDAYILFHGLRRMMRMNTIEFLHFIVTPTQGSPSTIFWRFKSSGSFFVGYVFIGKFLSGSSNLNLCNGRNEHSKPVSFYTFRLALDISYREPV